MKTSREETSAFEMVPNEEFKSTRKRRETSPRHTVLGLGVVINQRNGRKGPPTIVDDVQRTSISLVVTSS